MVLNEIRELVNIISSSSDLYTIESQMEKLLRIIERNMEEVSEALNQDFFFPEEVSLIAENVREATLYTGIQSLACSLFSWTERHKDNPLYNEIRPYAEEAYRVKDDLPFF